MTTRYLSDECQERLAIALEAGVPPKRARELARDDAKECAKGRVCICMQTSRRNPASLGASGLMDAAGD